MSLTLLVENNPKIESFYVLNLHTWLGLDVITKKDAKSAIELISTNSSNINLIIARANVNNEESAKKIITFLNEKNIKVPVVVIGPGAEVPGSFAHVPNSLQIKILIQSAGKALNITAKEMNSKVVPDYFPISIEFFQYLKRSICPVYSQDPQNAGKYVLRLKKLEEFDDKVISKFKNEGITILYVSKLDRLQFTYNVTSELISALESKDVSEDENVHLLDKSVELLSNKVLNIGITEETIALAEKNMAGIAKQLKGNPKFSSLLDRLLKNQASYQYKHIQILTYVCLHIMRNVDWGNKEQEDKISFIAFFHDIVLENDEQAKIKSNLELKKSTLSDAEKKLVEKHAQLSAELAGKYPHSPMGSDQIIRQHHGTLNGIGFSEHYGNNVSPISIVFIIAEEFTRIILDNEKNLNLKEMLRELKEEFPTSRFQKVIETLESISI